jgi:alpha-galactosidase
MRRVLLTVLCISLSPSFHYGGQSLFDPQQNTWTLTNGWIRTVFQLTPEGYFRTLLLSDLRSGDQWHASPSDPMTPIRLQVGSDVFDAYRQYNLINHGAEVLGNNGIRQTIVLEDLSHTAEITLIFHMYEDQPVLRYHTRYRNLTGNTAHVNSVNMLPWTFTSEGRRHTALQVNQWSVHLRPESFEPLQTVLEPGGPAAEIRAGAQGEHCGWVALRDGTSRGLFAGWEFDGRSRTTVRRSESGGEIELGSSISDLHHPVEPQETFRVPWAFIGMFHGDFDEAGYRTHQFVNAVLAAKISPDPKTFPYVSWDSWGYQTSIDEHTLRRNADRAAELGVELFIVDLGWARSLGDWYADPEKFPSGLAALSDYVHSLGMKFGLHFALAEADAKSPVLQANPDWTASVNDHYFGAESLCLSHQPAKDWLVQQAIRMIDDYKVDWILQDGENMVKRCTRTNHTHDPADSNYSNAVNGINAVVSAVQAARPEVMWENCENGGNMMTFNMVKSYATSITSDAAGSFSSRRAVYGATYPFPPRFAARYMPDSDGLHPYATHSYRFGGNWVLMNRLADLNVDQLGFLKQQVEKYKLQRIDIAEGKVYHHAAPDANGTDAIQSYNSRTGISIAVIARAGSGRPAYIFRPRGLDPATWYAVWFDVDSSVYFMAGSQLMDTGVRVILPTPFSSDVVHIEAR